jgi:Tfp pilus assembly protein PilF
MMMSLRFVPVVLALLTLAVACVPVEQVKPKKEIAEYHTILGVSALNEKNPTEALREFLLAEEADPNDPEIQSGLAQAYVGKRAYELAEQHLLKAIALSNDKPKYENNLGALYLTMGRYDDAIVRLRKAADNLLFARADQAWTAIGIAYYQKQDYASAETAYKKAMMLNPQFVRAPFRLGELYYNLDRPAEALDIFKRAIQLAPGFSTAHYWLGLTYMKMKDHDQARAAFSEALRLAPDSEVARLSANYLRIIDQ